MKGNSCIARFGGRKEVNWVQKPGGNNDHTCLVVRKWLDRRKKGGKKILVWWGGKFLNSLRLAKNKKDSGREKNEKRSKHPRS